MGIAGMGNSYPLAGADSLHATRCRMVDSSNDISEQRSSPQQRVVACCPHRLGACVPLWDQRVGGLEIDVVPRDRLVFVYDWGVDA